ncbi:alkene reductase [Rapidithrix thailandica]|uniref:Alkene reductase n=1 Tax=Rapidithrix thailandica TaxID=413964 RepID=A0AAW9S3Y6_9BACT
MESVNPNTENASAQEDILFTEYQIGPFTTGNRIVMPPMSRTRSGKGSVATDMMAEYYRQRASAGLIITEATQISQQGQGYAWTPGIYTPEQVESWKKVTQAVHQEGGVIFAQLWHTGRVSHNSLQPNNQSPVSCTAKLAEGVTVFIDPEGKGPEGGVGGMVQHSEPRALSIPEIQEVIRDYATAAKNAIAAGFDGVELHGANGYLINQFLVSQVNDRTDAYGGTLENRLRFMKEATQAVAEAIGKEKVGVRLSPLITLRGTIDDKPEETYLAAVKALNDMGIEFIHIAEAEWEDAPIMDVALKQAFRKAFSGTMIYSGKYTKERADEALQQGWADMIGFGRPFIANPDLPSRLKHGHPLTEGNPATYFGGGAEGFIDYPAFEEATV